MRSPPTKGPWEDVFNVAAMEVQDLGSVEAEVTKAEAKTGNRQVQKNSDVECEELDCFLQKFYNRQFDVVDRRAFVDIFLLRELRCRAISNSFRDRIDAPTVNVDRAMTTLINGTSSHVSVVQRLHAISR
ncbi:hypothetical protein CYMTET_41911 [Cymbomonas tetramitiformis]|uniref:Uncharacterized protein n=1 Tax=Cymbomonas tetramitiformis TaxID=36881 RepID=A0AAE0C6G9_9CHLO|nr:hypothetical protein CYMTET_41911 [Cymbomonas tetramitiformis]